MDKLWTKDLKIIISSHEMLQSTAVEFAAIEMQSGDQKYNIVFPRLKVRLELIYKIEIIFQTWIIIFFHNR